MLKISTILTIYQMASDAIKELKQAPRQPASEHQSLIEALVDVRDLSARLGGQLAWQQALKGSSAPEPASAPAPAPEPDPLPQPDVELAPGETHQALLRLAQIALPEPVSNPSRTPAMLRALSVLGEEPIEVKPGSGVDVWLSAVKARAGKLRKSGDPSTAYILKIADGYVRHMRWLGVPLGKPFEAARDDIAIKSACGKTSVTQVTRWLAKHGLVKQSAPAQGRLSHLALTLPAPGGSSSLARPDWLAAALKSLAGRRTGEADPEALKGVIRACARLAKWQGDAMIIKAPAIVFAEEACTTASTALRCIYWMRAKGLATTKQAPTKQKPIEMTLTMPGGAQ